MFVKFAVFIMLSTVSACASTVAHVYVQTTKGVNLYNASSSGTLTMASGSPFKTVGLAVGTNGYYFFSNGLNYIHVYAMNYSSGQIKGEVAHIDTSLFPGAECGTTGKTFLDHSGTFIFVQHDNGLTDDNGGRCYVIQTYKIASNGQLTFVGSVNGYAGRGEATPVGHALTSNNSFVYAGVSSEWGNGLVGFSRDNLGALQSMPMNVSYPPTYDSSYQWELAVVAADPTNHLAVLGYQINGATATSGPLQLASYSVDAKGNLSSTMSYNQMYSPVVGGEMSMSRDGLALALFCSQGGMQLYNFHGGDVPTPLSGLLTNAPITHVQWDRVRHAYALGADGSMLIYAVGSGTITETAAYRIPNIASPTALIVR